MLTRWDPFREMQRLQDELFTRPAGQARQSGFLPAVDIHEDDTAFRLDVDVPGMKPEEIDVNIEKNLLTISGERKLAREEQKEGYRRVERAFGSFSRSFTLPENVDAEAIEAKVADGTLTITLPKREPKNGARKIAVKA